MKSDVERTTNIKHDNLEECLKLKLGLIKLDKCINRQFNKKLKKISSIQLKVLESGMEEYNVLNQELIALDEKCDKLLGKFDNLVVRAPN